MITAVFARLRRSASAHPLGVDSLLAVLLAVLLGFEAIFRTPADMSTGREIGHALFAATALILAVRRRNPYLCLITVLAFTIAGYAVLNPFPPTVLPAAIAAYSVATVARGRRLVFVAGGTLAIAILLGFISGDRFIPGDRYGPTQDLARSLVFEVIWVVGALAVGSAVANRRAYIEQIRQRAILAEKTKEQEAQRRVDEERMRIARDVHDGVAHALASISILAGAGNAVLDRDPKAAREVLKDIRAASTSALSELRSTIGLLRYDDHEPAADKMDREQIERLVAVLRAEGILVRVKESRPGWTLRGETAAALHRILQESLTNVIRHSGAGEVDVAVDHTNESVLLTVTDYGRTGAPDAASSPTQGSEEARGYGLVGMRERASLLGGSVESGPRPEGGFQVRAILPIRDES